MHPNYKSLEEIELIAWHHMLNDPELRTYTFENGVEKRTWVNPDLKMKRSLRDLGRAFVGIANVFQEKFKPTLDNLINQLQWMMDYHDEEKAALDRWSTDYDASQAKRT